MARLLDALRLSNCRPPKATREESGVGIFAEFLNDPQVIRIQEGEEVRTLRGPEIDDEVRGRSGWDDWIPVIVTEPSGFAESDASRP